MLERTQVFVDTSYLLASFYNSWETGARAQLEIDLPEVVNVLGGMIQSQLGQPIQRQMWYDGIPDSGPHRYQRALRTCDGVQLRAGQLIEWGERRTQKAVDTRLVADMVIAGLRGQCSDIVLVSGDADMLPGVKEATAAGLRVHLYGFGWDSMSSALRHACDSTTILDPREDFADCMQLQVLEGPLPPVVRGKPVGDVEPPEDKGPTRVPNVSPHMPHGSAPAPHTPAEQPAPAADSDQPAGSDGDGAPADSQATPRPGDGVQAGDPPFTTTDGNEENTPVATGVPADGDCRDQVPAPSPTAAADKDTPSPASGEPQAAGDKADQPENDPAGQQSPVDDGPAEQSPVEKPVTDDAHASQSADSTQPWPAAPAGDSPAPTPATNAGVRQHPGSESPSEEDARQRAIVEAHRESQEPKTQAPGTPHAADNKEHPADSQPNAATPPAADKPVPGPAGSGQPAADGETADKVVGDNRDGTDGDSENSGSAADNSDSPATDSTATDSSDDRPQPAAPSPGDVPKKTVPLPSMMAPKRRLNSRYVPVSNEVWESAGFQTPYDVGQQYAIWWYDNAATDEQLDRAHELSGGSLPNEVDRPLLQFACERLHEYTLTDTQRVALRDGFHHGIRGVLLNRRSN